MGGSESRFILGNVEPTGSNNEKMKYIMSNTHQYDTPIELGDRNPSNRYQKFRIQAINKDKGVYIRFDNHPQPGIRMTKDNLVELYNASWDTNGEWTIMVIQAFVNNVWTSPPTEQINWNADHRKKIHKLRVIIVHTHSGKFLHVNPKGQVALKEVNHEHDAAELKDIPIFRSMRMVWELEYVDHQLSANEVTAAVVIPAAAIGATAAAVAFAAYGVAGAVGAAAFTEFGFSAIPVMQTLGPIALSQAQNLTVFIVGALATKAYDAAVAS